MKNLQKTVKTMKGITLIALTITIMILIILVGLSINIILGKEGLLNKTKIATEEYNKESATESINLKITICQMNTYAETQRMPTLKELAVELEKDDEIQYVNSSQKIASIKDINFATVTSIFTKLKAYPYEFEINSSLQLASIDGIKIANVPMSDEDTIVSMTKKELKKMIQDEINAVISSINVSEKYSTSEQIAGTWTDGKPIYKKTIFTGSDKAISAKTWTTLATDTSLKDIEQLIKTEVTRSSNKEARTEDQQTVKVDRTSGDIQIYTEVSYLVPSIITLYYTKTTDSIPTSIVN